jgi:hypothetical protein
MWMISSLMQILSLKCFPLPALASALCTFTSLNIEAKSHSLIRELYILSLFVGGTAVGVGGTGISHHVSPRSTDEVLEAEDAELFDPIELRGEEAPVVEVDFTDFVE